MAERNVTYIPHTAEDSIDYKPLAWPAVLGLVIAICYGAFLIAYGIAAAVKGEPLFLGGWTMAMPVAGTVLSGLGLWQIRRSEGTRAGAALARWGLGLSLVLGLGYLTYQTFTGLAILQQANRFLMERDEQSGFFARLQGNDADVRSAFLYTLDVSERSVRPENARDMESMDVPSKLNPKGQLTQFLEHPLVRLLRGANADGVKAVVDPLAVHDWTYDQGAYHIARGYRITTQEGVFEVGLSISSVEPTTAGERRSWRVNWQPTIPVVPISRTELGKHRDRLRQQAAQFLADPKTGWFGNLIRRRTFETYLGTQPPQQREALRESAAALAGTPLTALAGPVTASLSINEEQTYLQKLLPNYRPSSRIGEYFGLERFRNWENDQQILAEVKQGIAEALTPARIHQLSIRLMPSEFAPCEVQDGEISVLCQALFVIPVNFSFIEKKRLDIVVQADVVVAAPAGLDPMAANSLHQWRVKSLDLVRAWPQMDR